MIGSQWERMWELFHEGLELPAAERAAFLAAACDSEDLRIEVEDLLACHADMEATDGPPRVDAAGAEAPDDELLGTRLGPYRLVRVLGSGGMGVVYLAERVDGELDHRVAIKLLPSGKRTDDGLWRFRLERQILAGLEHPNVARLLDAGTTGDGRPYFVMEHVEGEPIDRYCEARRLPLEARIELMRTVSSAVHATHQNLVIHRDLKPGNLLVTPDGVPKLLDFGIAKLLEPAGETWFTRQTVSARQTVEISRRMTLAYASPEQLRGEAVTTASDVYALGVVLYELVTGRHPFPEATSSPFEMMRQVCDVVPEAPSAAVLRAPDTAGVEARRAAFGISPERLSRRLRGDLDTIVLTALDKEPGRRYGSAEQLADDLGRYLGARPVLARKDTVGYRLGKLLRRHPVGSAAAALFVLVLLAFAATMTVQSARLERERVHAEAQRVTAERERERAERISGFLVDLFRVSYPSRAKGETVTARELLERGAGRVTEGLEDEPELQASLLHTMGSVYEALGLYEEASPLLEKSLALARGVHGESHPRVAEGLADLAILLQARGEYGTAEVLLREAIARRREQLGSEAPEVADSLNALGVMLHEAGEYERAEAAAVEALAIRRRVHGEESWQVAQSLLNLGWLVHDRGRFAEADGHYRRALTLVRRLLGEDHRWTAKCLSNIALLQHDRGELDAAEDYYLQAWELDRRLFGGELRHPDLAIHLHNQGRLWNDRGELDRAERLYRRAFAIREEALPAEHPAIATSLTGLGRLATERGEAEAAEPLLRRALDIRRAALAPGNWHIAETETALGASLLAQGRLVEAAALLFTSVPVIEAQRGPDDLRARQARAHLDALGARLSRGPDALAGVP